MNSIVAWVLLERYIYIYMLFCSYIWCLQFVSTVCKVVEIKKNQGAQTTCASFEPHQRDHKQNKNKIALGNISICPRRYNLLNYSKLYFCVCDFCCRLCSGRDGGVGISVCGASHTALSSSTGVSDGIDRSPGIPRVCSTCRCFQPLHCDSSQQLVSSGRKQVD